MYEDEMQEVEAIPEEYRWLIYFSVALSIVIIVAFFYLCENVARIRRVLETEEEEREKAKEQVEKKEQLLNEQKKSKL